MGQSQDKIIRKAETPVIVEVDRDILNVAINLATADTNKDGKISKKKCLVT